MGNSVTTSLVLALKKTQDFPTPPWLKAPVYYRFMAALNPVIDESSVNGFQYELWRYLHAGEELTEDIHLACSYWNSPSIRRFLNALLFGGISSENLESSTKLPGRALAAYVSLFCDLSVFGGSKILLRDYLENLPILAEKDREEQELYQAAIRYGWEWILWKESYGMEGHMPGAKMVDITASIAFWKAMEIGLSPLTSDKTKEGKHFLKLAASIALDKHKAKMGSMTSIKEIQIKLTTAAESDNTYGFDTVPEIKEILYKRDDNE